MKKKIKAVQSFQLQQLIEESLQTFKVKEQDKELSLHLINDLVSPLFVKGDKEKLQETISLLLHNSVLLAGASKITVALKQLLKTDKEVLLEFTAEDNGTRTGEAFQKSFFTYKKDLAKVRVLIEECGGKIEVSDFDGLGATIKFLIKFLWESSPVEADKKNTTLSKLAGKKILVVEDNEINQKIIAHLLKREGIVVTLANNGKEAIDLFEKNKYDLLLIDLQMPHMDGFQTANYIRKKMKSTIPMIAMTASAFLDEQFRCFEVGINQYLKKPFTQEDILQCLRYFLLNEHQLINQKPFDISTRDLYSLQFLKQTNDDEQIVEILEMFIEKTPELLKEIKEALKISNYTSVIPMTAKLKGSLGSLQMQSMIRIVDEIELFVRTEDTSQLPFVLDQLNKEYELIYPLIKMELEKMREIKVS